MSLQTRSPSLRRRTGRAAALAAVGLGLACCSGSPPPDAAPTTPPAAAGSAAAGPTPAPTAAAAQWTSTVCRALDPVVGTLTTPPRPDLNNLAAARQSYLSYLGTAEQQADAARQQVTSAGAPPVKDGEQISATVREQLTQLRADIDQARSQIQQTDPNDAGSITQALTAAGNVGGSLANSEKVLATLRQNSELGRALDQEPSCATLRSAVGGS